MRLAKKAALMGRRELDSEWGSVAFKVYVPGVEAAEDVSFEVSNAVRLLQNTYTVLFGSCARDAPLQATNSQSAPYRINPSRPSNVVARLDGKQKYPLDGTLRRDRAALCRHAASL